MNPMQQIHVSKVTLNIGAGRDQRKLERGAKLIEALTGTAPVTTKTQKRIPGWGLRAGLPIGCKLTLRGKQAQDILKRMVYARDNKLPAGNFDHAGNFAFGVKEYVDIKDAKYDPELGMMGIEIMVTLEKPGYRIKRRKVRPSAIGSNQRVTREEAMEFAKTQYNVEIET